MQHTFWGKTGRERETKRERVLRPAAPFDCANVCAALEMCVSCYCCCIRRFTFLSATGGGSGEGGNCFLCALPAALKYFAYASSGLKRRLTMQGTKYVAILALCTLLISPPPATPLSLYTPCTHCANLSTSLFCHAGLKDTFEIECEILAEQPAN